MSRILLWAAFAMSIVAFSASAFAQAAVEGALTHGLSTAAGSSLGNALGNATNRLAGRVGQQVSNATPRQPVSSVKPGVQNGTAPAVMTPNGTGGSGSLIVSIQGAAPGTSACPAESKATTPLTAGKAGGVSAASQQAKVATPGAPKQDCVAKVANEAATHPSEITLPAPR